VGFLLLLYKPESIIFKLSLNCTRRLWRHLNANRDGRVDIVLDNSGFELFTDLCLAHWLVEARVVALCVHKHPMTPSPSLLTLLSLPLHTRSHAYLHMYAPVRVKHCADHRILLLVPPMLHGGIYSLARVPGWQTLRGNWYASTVSSFMAKQCHGLCQTSTGTTWTG